MASRALRLREGIAPIRDRLLMTLFLAALLHGIVILGITFGANARPSDPAPGLEVLLVSDEVPTADHNPKATYLAQRTQLGSGNTRDQVAPRNRASARPAIGHEGTDDGVSPVAPVQGLGAWAERVLATSSSQPDIRYLDDSGEQKSSAERPLAVPAHAGEPGPDDEQGPAQLRGPHRDELWVTPDTRESVVAPYVDNWIHRVERIGTLNFPAAASGTARKNPTLEVVIGADGKIQSARVSRSSGDAALDDAAITILKLASPFDPFPPELARERPTLNLRYTWQFEGGRLAHGSVSVAP